MKVIPFEVNTGIENMQIDRSLLEESIRTQSKKHILRLYGWSPKCVSLGRNQRTDFINRDFLKKHNIDLVKRLTGGRALLHDKELTYCYICPISTLQNGDSVIESYKEILQIFFEPFKMLGIDLEISERKHSNKDFNYCMQITTSADLCYKNKKLIGSAQYRKEGYILQHGSILLDYDKNLLETIFNETINTHLITSMKEINPDITIADLIHLWDKYNDI